MIQDQFTCGEEGHDDQQLNFVCLNYNCKNNSPCCQLCVQQFHKEHKKQCQKQNTIGNYFDENQLKPFEQEIVSNIELSKISFQKQVMAIRQLLQGADHIQRGKQIQYVLDQYLNQMRKIDTIRATAMQINETFLTQLSSIIRDRKVNDSIDLQTNVKLMNQVMEESIQFAKNQNKIQQEIENLQQQQQIQESQIQVNDLENVTGYTYYMDILRGLLEQNYQFEDPDFPPNQVSSGYDCLWARVGDYCKKDIKFFTNEKGPNIFASSRYMELRDIMQGLTGNEVFSQVLCLIANSNPKELQSVFITQEISPNNIYALKLLKDGIDQVIIVDDYIPYAYEYEIPITMIGSNGAIWSAILEKAIMKIKGSYYKGWKELPPVLIETILRGPTISLSTENPMILQFIKEELNQKCFLSCFDSQDIVICQILGIEMIKHPQFGEVELILLRTPKEKWWTGEWSHSSPKWTPQLKEQVQLDAKTKMGNFYMTLESFQDYFPIAYSCRNSLNIFNQLLVSQRKNQATYFKFTLENTGKYAIAVKPKDDYLTNTTNKITIFKVENDKSYSYVDSFYNLTMKYQQMFNLNKGTYIGYVRVYWKDQQEADATISVSGQYKVDLIQIQKIPNLVRLALGQEAKLRGRKISNHGLEQCMLELPDKGWYVMFVQNTGFAPFLLKIPKYKQIKYMKPNFENQEMQIMPGMSETVVGKTQIKLKTTPLENVVGIILSGFTG